MSSVGRITSGQVSGPRGPSASGPNANSDFGNFKISFHEQFQFPKKKLEIKEQANAQVAPQEHPYFAILYKLFMEMLECRLDIVPTQPTDAGGYAVEAFFRPPEGVAKKGAIHLPLPIKALGKKVVRAPTSNGALPQDFIQFVQGYVETIMMNFSNQQIMRLIVVAAHEYGHFQSYSRGNHDENLRKGLYIYQRKYLSNPNADDFTWLVFREECVAWSHAETFLKKTSFEEWKAFEDVKNHSLKTYFDTLKLTDASLNTFYKLSFLGDDFKKNSPSQLFNKEPKTAGA